MTGSADTPRREELPAHVQNLIAAAQGLPEVRSRARHRGTRGEALPMADLLVATLKSHHIGERTPEQALAEQWPSLAGPSLAAHSHPIRLEASGRLLVAVSHAVYGQELQFSKRQILQRIRALPGYDGVCDLVPRAG